MTNTETPRPLDPAVVYARRALESALADLDDARSLPSYLLSQEVPPCQRAVERAKDRLRRLGQPV